jgi:DNA replication protein DnaC
MDSQVNERDSATRGHEGGMEMLRKLQASSPKPAEVKSPVEVAYVITDRVAKARIQAKENQARWEREAPERAENEMRRFKDNILWSLAQDLGSRYSEEKVELSNFEIYHDNQRAVLDRLRLFDFGKLVADGRNLLFFGPVGTGKDHLLAYALYRAARNFTPTSEAAERLGGRPHAGYFCRFLTCQEFYGKSRDLMDSRKSEDHFISELATPKILALSDPVPPVGEISPWNVAQLHRLVDRRYRAMKSTWMTVNASGIEDLDSRLSSPVFDRLREGAEILGCEWPSYRERR